LCSDSYQWTINNQTLSNPNISNPIASPLETTAYYVVLDSAGCATLDSVVVNVNLPPQFVINEGVNPVEFCNESSVLLYATSNNEWNYTWSGPEDAQGDSANVSSAGLYTLLVTDNFGCNNSETVTLVVIPNASFDFSELRNILCCTEDEIIFNPEFFINNGLALSEIYWNGDLISGEITVSSSENAVIEQNVLSTLDENGCITEVLLDFETKCADPEILSIDTVYSSLPVEFNVIYVESEGAYYEFDWSINSTLSGSFVDYTVQNPVFVPSENEGEYTTSVEVYSYYLLNNDEYYLCQEVAEQNFKVIFVNNSKIPDAFTPNGDGVNDYFYPVLDALSIVKEFRIYNRWNQMVYQLSDNSQGWDGNFKENKQPADLYLYYIKIETPVGDEIYKGSFTLIR
jgi:gliding motility-associated-like protein